MKTGSGGPAVKSARITRIQIIVAIGLVSLGVLLWAVYDLGQIQAGYNRFAARERYQQLEQELRARRTEEQQLRERVAQLETNAKIDGEAYAKVGSELDRLEAQILSQQEELAFYQGIVSDQQSGVRVQDFTLWHGKTPSTFHMRLVLAQAMRAGSRISGTVELHVEGTANDQEKTFGLGELHAGDTGQARLDFSFRYFQNLESDLVLPDGFAPERVTVTLKPRGKSAKTIEKSFDWSVESG